MEVASYETNPGLLKLALYCEGMRLSVSAMENLKEGRQLMRTRAGLGSGLELVLPHNLWTNVPVKEHFCKDSAFELDCKGDQFFIAHDQGANVPVTLAPRPDWYDAQCTTGKLMRHVGSLQGTYLGIYPTDVCEFWRKDVSENCRYCSIGLNLGSQDAEKKTLQEILEVVLRARSESHITYVDFNTGHYEDESYLDRLEPILDAVKKATGLLVGVQTPPHHDWQRYNRLMDLGVNRVSFCFELFDQQRFQTVCPGKHRFYGLDHYLKTMDYCANLGAKQRLTEPWVTNGEMIAGLEEPESTIAGIDRITSVGAIPTVCVFRPLSGTPMADLMPPKTEAMVPVFKHLFEACVRHNLPIGLAPNIHVSLVMLPEECSWFSDVPHRWFQAKNYVKHKAFSYILKRKLARFA